MDLDSHGQRPAANIVLNRYLWRSNSDLDLRGLQALPLFLGLRAGVRAMVTVDRAAQEDRMAAEQQGACAAYLHAALEYLAPAATAHRRWRAVWNGQDNPGCRSCARVSANAGCDPSAKRPRAQSLARRPRDDAARRRSLTPETRKTVYEILCRKADLALSAGQSVVADAVYSDRRSDRGSRRSLPAGAPFRGLWLTAKDVQRLVARVAARRNDASDATPKLVADQQTWDTGALSQAWTIIDAGAGPDQTRRRALLALGS